MSDIEENRVGSNSNPIVLSDDDSSLIVLSDGDSTLIDLSGDEKVMNYEPDNSKIRSLEHICRELMKTSAYGSDDEVIREYDRVVGQTKMDIYKAFLRVESDSEPEIEFEFEPEPEPKPESEPEPEPEPEPDNHQLQGPRRSSRPRKQAYYFDMDDDDELKFELFSLEGYRESKDKSDDVSL
ncbi:uncharacterized protein [Spinacia oleracea]|uniref:Uncharacterized protein n=1 Tax=Spinacia oleracea TaxID=3562 RepID=A0A9R0ITT0_SPIOL|nr:uncharacterized protein LOC110793772 [Spinacia oleracea]